MYQSQVLVQNTPQLFTSAAPKTLAQTYVAQPAQVITTPQAIVPQMSQVVMAPQVPSVVPQVQTSIVPTVQATMVPQVQSVVPNLMTVPAAVPQGPVVTPYVLPKGSRMPMIAQHQGLIQPGFNFSYIGGCPYGRISMIK